MQIWSQFNHQALETKNENVIQWTSLTSCHTFISNIQFLNFFRYFFLKTVFVSSHMYPENPEGTQVIVGSMDMRYISDTARNQTLNLFCPKREPFPLGNSDGHICQVPTCLLLYWCTIVTRIWCRCYVKQEVFCGHEINNNLDIIFCRVQDRWKLDRLCCPGVGKGCERYSRRELTLKYIFWRLLRFETFLTDLLAASTILWGLNWLVRARKIDQIELRCLRWKKENCLLPLYIQTVFPTSMHLSTCSMKRWIILVIWKALFLNRRAYTSVLAAEFHVGISFYSSWFDSSGNKFSKTQH